MERCIHNIKIYATHSFKTYYVQILSKNTVSYYIVHIHCILRLQHSATGLLH